MKAITVWQPWASLIALGVKTIETRSWSTDYRGPLAIHAAKSPSSWVDMDEKVLRSDRVEADAVLNALGVVEVTDDGSESWPTPTIHPDRIFIHPHTLPLGAVVATCTLVDVAPIGGPYSFSTGIVEGEAPATAGMDVIVHHPDLGHGPELVLDRWHGANEVISGQLPFGDFTPGRYAWLLEDVKPTTERCPLCWGSGEVRKPKEVIGGIPDREDKFSVWPCSQCGGVGVCDPVPAKGRQRLWNWEPA